MAESKGALIAKSMQKHAGRAKEKLLQNLGKVDRTLDDIFEEHLQNFNRQHQQATRLQKEFNNYIRCIRAVQTASKTLMEAITDVYESGWSGHDLLYVQAQNMEMLWQDFSHKLGDQVLIPLNTYTNQFPETRKKIEKRGRKLVDYDSQRHSFQNLQANSAKRRDDVKITKGREQLEEAKRTYEVLNSELHDELPALFDSRVLFFVNNLQTLFSAEQLFHSESAKVFTELEAITDKLASESQRGSYKKPIAINNITPHATPKATLAITSHNGNGTASHNNTLQMSPTTPTQNGDSPSPPITPVRAILATSCENIKETHGDDIETKKDKQVEELYDIPPAGSPTTSLDSPPTSPKTNGNKNSNVDEEVKKNDIEEDVVDNPAVDKVLVEKPLVDKTHSDKPLADKPHAEKQVGKETVTAQDEKPEEVYDIPVGATVAGLPPGVLYRVRATYRYAREDGDELSFDIGDVIRVVEYDDPDEQEEGWLMGIKESTNEKGMFPANFTRPI